MHDDSMGIAGSAGGFFARTTDGGATWQDLGRVKPDPGEMASFPVGSTKAWIAGGRTVACSYDNGATWALQAIEPVSAPFYAMSFCDPASGWIVTGAGEILHYRELPTTVRPEHEGSSPIQVLLQQNYPNPFNPSTRIQYALPHRSYVTLTVFNALGQRVATLVNGEVEAGYHEVTFNASTLASGVYFYRIQAGNFNRVKKLVLLK